MPPLGGYARDRGSQHRRVAQRLLPLFALVRRAERSRILGTLISPGCLTDTRGAKAEVAAKPCAVLHVSRDLACARIDQDK